LLRAANGYFAEHPSWFLCSIDYFESHKERLETSIRRYMTAQPIAA